MPAKIIKNHLDIIDLWGDHQPYYVLADDICGKAAKEARRNLVREMCRNWSRRGRISCECYLDVVHAAQKRGFNVDLDLLHRTR